jgi:hypothetical protein
MSSSFFALSTATASTKRNPIAVGGVVAAPATYLTGLKTLPLMPITDEIILRYAIQSPKELQVTYIEGVVDIEEGDVLVIGTAEYMVRAASPWPAYYYTEAIVEEQVGT